MSSYKTAGNISFTLHVFFFDLDSVNLTVFVRAYGVTDCGALLGYGKTNSTHIDTSKTHQSKLCMLWWYHECSVWGNELAAGGNQGTEIQ